MSRGVEFARTVTRVATAATVFLGVEVAANPVVGPFIERTANHIREAVIAAKAGDFSLLTMPLKRIVDAQGNPTFYITAAAAGPVATPNPERKIANGEALTSSNPLEFTYPDLNGQSVRRRWEMDNARFGIFPNDPDRRVGTIDDFNRDTGQILNYIQPNTALYPETSQGHGVSVVIGGQLVDISTGKVYLATEVNDGITYPKLEIIPDINKPNDYAARKVHNNGLPTGGSDKGDAVGWGFVLASNNQGKYLELEIRYSKDPKDNGKYRLRLDSAGNPVGDWIHVVQHTNYIPSVSTGDRKVSN